MEIELAWLLVLPVVFGMGWLLAKYDRRQQHRESRHLPRDILDGASAILGDDYALATESLLKAARSAPDSSDLHRVVGNLYRKRGMTDRAIEVHEIALRNPALTDDERALFLLDLGRDFLAAGIFDRAEDTLKQLLDGVHANSARLLLLIIAQRTRDWQAAIDVARATKFPSDVSFAQLMGHFHCELAEAALQRKDTSAAQAFLDQAAAFDAPGPAQRVKDLRLQMDQQLNQRLGEHPNEQLNKPAGSDASVATAAALAVTAAAVSGMPVAATAAAAAPSPAFICAACGFRTRRHYWQCPGCHRWDSVEVSR